MSDTSVKYFLSSQTDLVPPLSATPGALYNVLKACLVTAVGAINVSSINVSGGIATATFATAHGYLDGQVIELAGAAPSGLNGQARILSVPTANSLTFATDVADGAASGAITAKLASAGWEEVFSATNKGVFRALNEDATGMLLRLDDTGTTAARVVGYRAMSSIDAGTGAFPDDVDQPGGLYWPKAHNATGSRAWCVVADERAFYLYVQPTSGSSYGSLLGFGDLIAPSDDAAPAFVAGHATALFAGGAGCLSAVSAAAAVTLVLADSAAGLGAPVQGYLMSALRTSGVSGSSTGSQYPTFPDPARGGVLLTPPTVIAGGHRGVLPGVLHTPQTVIVRLAYPDRSAVPGYLPVSTFVGAPGVALLQTEGDWRAAQ